MTVEGCREWRERLGPYVLGQLPEEERAATSAHIEGCAACREEAESLAPLAQLLPRVDPARLKQAPTPPPGLGERIAARIGREGRSRRLRRRRLAVGLSGAGAAAAAIAAVLAALVLTSGDPDPGTRVTFSELPGEMEIAATLEPRPFGTEIRMEVHGVRSGTLCRVYLRRADGRAMPAGSFRYRYGGKGEAVLTDALDLSAARAIVVKVGRKTFVAPMRHGVGASSWTRPTA